MSSREPRTVRVDPEVWSAFTDQVVEWEGQKHGEIGRHVENALSEYIDHGREARIESKVDEILTHLSENSDSHTHTANAAPSTMTERVEAVGREIAKMDRTVVRDKDVESEIKEYVRDDRSIRKYKRELKDMGLAYEHPGDSRVWTTTREQWITWVEGHVDNVPDAHVRDLIDSYPITFEEYDQQTTVTP